MPITISSGIPSSNDGSEEDIISPNVVNDGVELASDSENEIKSLHEVDDRSKMVQFDDFEEVKSIPEVQHP